MDNWQSGSSLEGLKQRAELLAALRDFFRQRAVMEVDVPLLGRSSVTDINIESISAVVSGNSGYLQTSPEYFLKRLLASGAGDIYCLGKAFRDGESGGRHNPEFTLLEWYRLGWDEHQLMDELAELIQPLFVAQDKPMATVKMTYAEAFTSVLGLDPQDTALVNLQELAVVYGSASWADESRSNCLDLLFSLCVEPQLPAGLVFIYDYPACQSALAQIHSNDKGQLVSRRFEAFINGMELANGYFELTDAVEQARRFASDVQQRAQAGQSEVPVDKHLLDALEAGMPACAGVALGVDRLLMQLQSAGSIAEIMPFSWDRC